MALNLLSDILTFMRRLIKTPSNASITDSLLIDYVNRFWIMDVDARIQLFDLKTTYSFQTSPGVDQYNMPLYMLQTENGGDIGPYPIYQGFLDPVYVNGIQIPFQTDQTSFYNIWPNIVQQMNTVITGNGTNGPYNFCFPISPNNETPANPPFQYILRGHTDLTGIIANYNNSNTLSDPIFGPTLANDLGVPVVPSTSIYPAVYITALDANGNSIVVQDSGQFLEIGSARMPNYGLLMVPGGAPYGYSAMPFGYIESSPITGATQAAQAVLTTSTTYEPGQRVTISGVVGMTQLNGNTYTVVANTGTLLTINVNSLAFTPYASGGIVSSVQNVVNYLTATVENLYFPVPIPAGNCISAQCFLFQCGLPRGVLFYNNTLIFRSPPDRQYLIQLTAYLSPAAFFNTPNAIPFGYMAEYIARGAARKILSDTGDWEQFQAYEPLFREQEMLVWKRSQRIWTATRTETIYSQGINQGQQGYNSLGGTT
jgi:hypothetical protein